MTDLDSLKQEILAEVRREINKAKVEIIEGWSVSLKLTASFGGRLLGEPGFRLSSFSKREYLETVCVEVCGLAGALPGIQPTVSQR